MAYRQTLVVSRSVLSRLSSLSALPAVAALIAVVAVSEVCARETERSGAALPTTLAAIFRTAPLVSPGTRRRAAGGAESERRDDGGDEEDG